MISCEPRSVLWSVQSWRIHKGGKTTARTWIFCCGASRTIMWKRMLLASRRHPELRNSASTRGWYSCRDADTSIAGRRRIKNIFRDPAATAAGWTFVVIYQARSILFHRLRLFGNLPGRPSTSSCSLPPPAYLSLSLRQLHSQISPKLEHRQDVDKPVIDVGNSTNPRATLATTIWSTIHTTEPLRGNIKNDLCSNVYRKMSLYEFFKKPPESWGHRKKHQD